ncbi:NAD(P)-dependent oxidoreductase [Edaphobacillus lindanitolerans]|uniref:3-hydroxyisobutyrate dehydrogenase n=1 Tax=Edaphobacillus lindanitolerans TaxID=550447 RepID=A0A1U7PKJ8_9BACI|nr:NAD(P)-dependent oxidoreductase [Edaphobacillus lindanitolerans]SIT73442.1 3-hydroxyisobutyrate dehydrogenase [Edaphobacillus lindanitolerans]
MERIGVVGCGLMGSGLVKNLIKHQYRVYVFDVNKEAVRRAIDMGASVCETIPDLAGKVECMILSLPSPELVERTMEEAFPEINEGTVVMDMSTNDVGLTRKLALKASERKVNFFDCPLSGGPAGAESGTLTVMVGGDEEGLPNAMPVLRAIGSHIEYLGTSGAGQIAKLCHNMVVGGVISLLSEAFMTGEQAGVPKEKIAAVLQKGTGQTRVMDVFGPNLLKESFAEVIFSLSNMRKDVTLYRSLAESVGVPTISSEPSRQLLDIAAHLNNEQKDVTAVYEIIEQFTGGKEQRRRLFNK